MNSRSPLRFHLTNFQKLFALIFALMQLHLLIVAMYTIEGFGDLGTVFRPSIFFISFVLMSEIVNKKDFDLKIVLLGLTPFIVFSFLWAVLEYVGPPAFDELNFLLFKRAEKADFYSYSTVFSGVSYYAGFLYLSLAILYAGFSHVYGGIYRINFILASTIVILAQSKMQIVCLVLLILMWLLFRPSVKKGFILSILFIISALIFYPIYDRLALDFGRMIAIKSTLSIIAADGSSQTLSLRSEQIINSVQKIEDTPLGAGLGRGIYLESWLAEYIYRYGWLGLLYFSGLVLVPAVAISERLCWKRISVDLRAMHWFFLVWLLLLPISQLSTVSILFSKTMFIALLMFSWSMRKW